MSSILRLRETGILDHLVSEASSNATECMKPISSTVTTSELRPLKITDFYGVFLLYLAGQRLFDLTVYCSTIIRVCVCALASVFLPNHYYFAIIIIIITVERCIP